MLTSSAVLVIWSMRLNSTNWLVDLVQSDPAGRFVERTNLAQGIRGDGHGAHTRRC
ncbi:hypothetical protein M758_1G096000 [Ceratodon purpureus]|uniref:Uncharacterized protein n=1 Tax=Ceratodon purpureus TaxID=3225 RepID=A0A8T0J303_CERPU|nr:hypothetical protein KC19_1G089100 [Ceratodon purpureus]KAG0629342.1 hypothetical protein M758_1G096000 [Ceratodon purpureus]